MEHTNTLVDTSSNALNVLSAVAIELRKRGIECAVDYPAFLSITVGRMSMHCGFSDGTLGIDINENGEYNGETIESTATVETNISRIADHIACTYTEMKEVNGL